MRSKYWHGDFLDVVGSYYRVGPLIVSNGGHGFSARLQGRWAPLVDIPWRRIAWDTKYKIKRTIEIWTA